MCLPSVTILQYLEEEGARIENHTFQSSSDQCHHRHDQHHEPPTKGGCREKCSEVEANDSCLSLSRITNEQRTTEQRLVRIYCRRFQILYEGVPVSSHLLRVSTIQPSSHHTNELMSTDADHDGCTVRQSLERERWECPYIAIIVECANHVAPGWKRSWSGFHDRYSRGAEDFE